MGNRVRVSGWWLGWACLWLALTGSSAVHGQTGDWAIGGYVEAEARGFARAPAFPGQAEGVQSSMLLRPELDWQANRQQLTLIPFYRYDATDTERSHFDIREFLWQRSARNWNLAVGIGQVFWGVTESRHLVDIVNQVDLVEGPDLEQRLGQPMLNLSFERAWGTLSFYLLPGFRERTFPGVAGRLRTAYPVSADDARYTSPLGNRHVDLALRYAQVINDWDVGVYYFHGTGREPRLVVDPLRQVLIPYYDIIDQWGTDVQWTRNDWLWKFEGIVRRGQGKTFAAAVGGVEYTFYQIADSDADLGVLFELLVDGRDDTAPPTIYDRDGFLGLRLLFNDVSDSQVLAGLYRDMRKDETLFFFQAERRLAEHLKGALEVWAFAGASTDPLFASVRGDDFVQLSLAYYF